MAKTKGKEFVGPKSLCTCGHTGDGEYSDHADMGGHPAGAAGAGKAECLIKNCNCQRFTWKGWLKKFERFLESQKGGK
jgi:hypothetical protein